MALGTVFNVHDDGSGVLVTVSEGTVEVTSPLDSQDPSAQAVAIPVLNAGEQVRYIEGAPPGPVRQVNHVSVTAWRHGFIAIRNLPLSDALSEIDRYRPGRIVLLAETNGLEPVTARVSIGSIDDGLSALVATQGLKVTQVTRYLAFVR